MKKDAKYYENVELKLKKYEEKEMNRRLKIKESLKNKKQRGCKLGRPANREKDGYFLLILKQYQNKEITQKEAYSKLGISRETFVKWVSEEEKTL